jgi:hypothetical protein
LPYAKVPLATIKARTKAAILIANQKTRWHPVPNAACYDSLRRLMLIRCWMPRHFNVADFPVGVPNHEEGVKRLERDRSDTEKIASPKRPVRGTQCRTRSRPARFRRCSQLGQHLQPTRAGQRWQSGQLWRHPPSTVRKQEVIFRQVHEPGRVGPSVTSPTWAKSSAHLHRTRRATVHFRQTSCAISIDPSQIC